MYSKRLFIWCVNMGVKRCCVISCDNDNRYPAKIMEDVIKPEFLPQSCYVCYVMLCMLSFSLKLYFFFELFSIEYFGAFQVAL